MSNGLLFLVAGAGGFVGTVLRYGLTLVAQRAAFTFPHGTLAANLLGCLLLGAVMALVETTPVFSPSVRIFLATGVCGGFTTMSTFTYETFRLVQDGHFLYAALYAVLTLAGSVAMLLAGVFLVKGVLRLV